MDFLIYGKSTRCTLVRDVLHPTYIGHCPKCAINRTLTHKPHGETQPISTPSIPFHTLAMDFILGLPLCLKEYEFDTGNTTWTPPPTWTASNTLGTTDEDPNGAGETTETA
jgi:hypothetical protein